MGISGPMSFPGSISGTRSLREGVGISRGEGMSKGGGYMYVQGGYHGIWLASGRYASYWNAFLL